MRMGARSIVRAIGRLIAARTGIPFFDMFDLTPAAMTTEVKGMLAPTVWPTKRVRQELMRPCRGCWKARKSLCSGAMEGMSLAI